MKRLTKMLVIVVAAAALMQTYRAYTGLKYRCDALAGQANQDDILFQACIQSAHARANRDAQQIADLETKLEMLTVDKAESAGVKQVPVTQPP